MTTITLKNKSFYIAGKFRSGSHNEIMERFNQKGAHITSTISAQLDGFVAGISCKAQRNRARSRGVPILNEAEMLELLKHGEVTISQKDTIESTFNMSEAISELRGLFDGPPSSETWTRCLEIVEECDPEQHAELVHYMEHFIQNWDMSEGIRWTPVNHPPKHDTLLVGVNTMEWSYSNPTSELRTAPPMWIVEMLRGEYHIKHTLVRCVHLTEFKINGGQLTTLIANPYLTHMHTLVTGEKNNLSKSFLKALSTTTTLPELHTLYLNMKPSRVTQYMLDTWKSLTPETFTLNNLTHIYFGTEFDTPFRQVSRQRYLHQLDILEDIHVEYGRWQWKGPGLRWVRHKHQPHT